MGETLLAPSSSSPGAAVSPDKTLDNVDLWTPDLGYDVEFEGSGSALPTGWSWYRQDNLTYQEDNGVGSLVSPAVVDSNPRGILRALPTEASWTAYAKLRHIISRDGGASSAGIFLRDSTSGKQYYLCKYPYDGQADWRDYIEQWAGPTAYGSLVKNEKGSLTNPLYYAIRRNSATSWDFLIGDGYRWVVYASAVNVSTYLTPDQIGFGGRFGNSSALGHQVISCEWFRVR